MSLNMQPPPYRWETVAAPAGAVHILHGMSEHAGRYAGLAAALNERRLVVWAHDHRGHGRNPTSPVGLGHFADSDGWRLVVDDAWRVSDELRTIYPGLPLVLVAHSMGSFVAQALMPEHGEAYAAVVLMGTDGPLGLSGGLARAVANAQRAALGGRALDRALTPLVFGGYNRQFAPNRTNFDWLSRDEQSVDAYINDPLCGFRLTAQSWVDFLEGRRELAAPAQLARVPKDLPVRILWGTRDPVGGNGRGVEKLISAYGKAGMRNVTNVMYDGARHELVNETNRTEVLRELAEWLVQLIRSQSHA